MYPTFEVGAKVRIFSQSLSKWVHGKVLAIEPNGDINVLYGDGDTQRQKCVDPADKATVRRADADSQAASAEEAVPPDQLPQYAVGVPVEVYSKSLSKWMSGMVSAVEADGAVKVQYGDQVGNQSEMVVAVEEAKATLRLKGSTLTPAPVEDNAYEL